MQLQIEGDRLTLTLQGAERLWAVKLAPIVVPRAHVVRAEAALPPATWKQIRAPGTAIPGLIKAGTYYTDRGKEFWYTVQSRKDSPLTIELEGESYRRLALTIDDSAAWAERINAWIRG
ncbi:hypothetical protein [Sorangium cellulosum]|uniref:Bacterial Pleckstrin homology domain-containing protein n=1 Tax=Sorangium cellulosum TaxID=56 RepID=A0A150Q1W1_SORCE|nr:hypothetical protein [Sorangium cellulosum]KYF61954.1 hypothetical protein BE15_22580 [Sorangium cellulosum]